MQRSSGITAAALGNAPTNLGALQSLAEPEGTFSSATAAVIEQPVTFSGGGVINIDGTAIASSLIVLLLLLALSTNRILGLERMLG